MQALFGRHLSGQLRYSSKKITVIFEEKGQITVFLSLLLIVLIGFSFVVVEGVSSYSASALGEDAVKNAGENIPNITTSQVVIAGRKKTQDIRKQNRSNAGSSVL